MKSNARQGVAQHLAAHSGMGVTQLRAKYLEVFGEPSRSGNKGYLFKKLAWRIQSLAEGGLSERARRRAEELARDADVRTTVPRPPKESVGAAARTLVLAAQGGDGRDRLPIPGTVLTRTYRGKHVAVKDDGGAMKVTRCLIDANWGASTDVVYMFCRQSVHSAVLTPSHGRYVGAASNPFGDAPRRQGTGSGSIGASLAASRVGVDRCGTC